MFKRDPYASTRLLNKTTLALPEELTTLWDKEPFFLKWKNLFNDACTGLAIRGNSFAAAYRCASSQDLKSASLGRQVVYPSIQPF